MNSNKGRGPRLSRITSALLLGLTWTLADAADKTTEALDRHMADCSKQFGYDEASASKLGPNELSPTERQWRECVYQGIRTIMIPSARRPNAYREIIAKDKVMTDKIEPGEMTREERKGRLEHLVAKLGSAAAGVTAGSALSTSSPS